MERFSESDCSACGLPVPVDLMPDGDLVRYADAQATVEALQRERDHAKKMEAVQKEVADNQTWHVRELTAALDAERKKAQWLEGWQRTILGTGTDQEAVIRMAASVYTQTAVRCWREKVAALQSQLSQLQALVRALPVVGGDIELDIYGYVWAGRVEVCKFDNTGDAKSYADLLAYRATLDATPTERGQG